MRNAIGERAPIRDWQEQILLRSRMLCQRSWLRPVKGMLDDAVSDKCRRTDEGVLKNGVTGNREGERRPSGHIGISGSMGIDNEGGGLSLRLDDRMRPLAALSIFSFEMRSMPLFDLWIASLDCTGVTSRFEDG